MNIADNIFHRLFSVSMYKNLKMSLGRLSLSKDFINDTKGDLYPLINKKGSLFECIRANRYILKDGCAERVLGSFFPYATYELSFENKKGKTGFSFYTKNHRSEIKYGSGQIFFEDESGKEVFDSGDELSALIVSCRPGAFDVYTYKNNGACFIKTFKSAAFSNSDTYEEFKKGYVCFIAEDEAEITGGGFYIDSGVSQADIRPITYEDGTSIYENGKIFLTASVRLQEGCFQGVFSWIPGTAEFELTGAIFYDAGDGRWCGDVAASIIFNRFTNEWNLWVCSFAHNHVLGHSAFSGDPRFGINVIDIILMDFKKENKEERIRSFCGCEGDEDPAFIYDKKNKRWLMAICRLDEGTKNYRYRFFESDNPFEGYKYIGEGSDGQETGGSFVNIDGELYFICGNSFSLRSDYRIYTKNSMKIAKFDFCDGGFRGWGTVIPVAMGSRTRYYWLTFDRHNGSDYNWSYGNVYCFESVLPEKNR